MKIKVTYGKLQRVLVKLGYAADPPGINRIVFRHSESKLPIIIRRMRRNEILKPVDLLGVQTALANGGIVPKDKVDSLFQVDPIGLWHEIIDAEAEYQDEHGHSANILKLPVLQAYDLAKLRHNELGPLAERVMLDGIKAFEEVGLLGIPVKLVPDGTDFVFE